MGGIGAPQQGVRKSSLSDQGDIGPVRVYSRCEFYQAEGECFIGISSPAQTDLSTGITQLPGALEARF